MQSAEVLINGKQRTFLKSATKRMRRYRWDRPLQKNFKRILFKYKYPQKYNKKTSWRALRRNERAQKAKEQADSNFVLQPLVFLDETFEQRDTLHAIITFNKKWNRNITFESYWLEKFINKNLIEGKKNTAEAIIWDLLTKIKHVTARNPVLTLLDLFFTLKPIFMMIPKRVGIRVYQIPIHIAEYQGIKIVMKWFIQEARLFYNRTEKRRQKEEIKVKISEKAPIGVRSKKQRRLARRLQKKTKKMKKKKKWVRHRLI